LIRMLAQAPRHPVLAPSAVSLFAKASSMLYRSHSMLSVSTPRGLTSPASVLSPVIACSQCLAS
jgi:hypothetical protein